MDDADEEVEQDFLRSLSKYGINSVDEATLPPHLQQELDEISQMEDEMFTPESIGQISKSISRLFELSYYEASPEMRNARQQAHEAKLNHVPPADAELMWTMHKQDPLYYTGERLARQFGVSRRKAWLVLLGKEQSEAAATGKTFNAEKIRLIFEKDFDEMFNVKRHRKKPERPMEGIDLKNIVSEDEVYKKFLDTSTNNDYAATGDDQLPNWVKIPFHPPVSQAPLTPEQAKTVKRLPAKQPLPSLGSLEVASPVMITEMSRHISHRNVKDRQFMIKEVDGTLRTATEDEKKHMLRRGERAKMTKWGLGGKQRRRSLFRQRRIEQIKV